MLAKWLSGTDIVLSNNDLTARATFTANVEANVALTSGKFYYEVAITEYTGPDADVTSGVSFIFNTGESPFNEGYSYYGYNGDIRHANGNTAFGDIYGTGDVIGVAVDLDAGKVWFSLNGVWQNSGEPVTGNNPACTFTANSQFIACHGFGNASNHYAIMRNEMADFDYNAPSGFFSGYGFFGIDEYTVLCIHSDAADGNQVFDDSSESDHALNYAGNTHHETSRSHFGGSSIQVDGSGDWLQAADSDDFWFGDEDWTIDFWINRELDLTCNIAGQSNNDYSAWAWRLWQDNFGRFKFYYHNGLFGDSLTGVIFTTIDTWHHVAIVRTGTTITMYVDGVFDDDDSVSTDSIPNIAAKVGFGICGEYNSIPFNGFFDEIRISKGIARWTEDFDVPIFPYAVPPEQPEIIPTVDETNVKIGIGCEMTGLGGPEPVSALWKPGAPNIVLTENNQVAHPTASGIVYADQVIPSEGKVYFEIHIEETSDNNPDMHIGIVHVQDTDDPEDEGWSYWGYNGTKYHLNSAQAFAGNFGANDVIQVCIDFTNPSWTARLYMGNNNVWDNDGNTSNPATGAYPMYYLGLGESKTFFAAIKFWSTADGAYARLVTKQEEWVYVPPVGFYDVYASMPESPIEEINCGIGIRTKAKFIESAPDTRLLIHSDEVDGSAVFEDKSIFDHSIVVQGTGIRHTTAQQHFNASSLFGYYGSNPGLLSLDGDGEKWWTVCQNDFTIDWWYYLDTAVLHGFFGVWGTPVSDRTFLISYSNGGITFHWVDYSGSDHWEVAPWATLDTWTHIAVVRKNNLVRIYIGGVLGIEFEVGYTPFNSSDMPLQISGLDQDESGEGGEWNGNGYMDELRISSVARWWETFDPPTVPYGDPVTAAPEIDVKIGIGSELIAHSEGSQYAIWSEANLDGNFDFNFDPVAKKLIHRIGDTEQQRCEVDTTTFEEKYYFEWYIAQLVDSPNYFIGLTGLGDIYDEYLGYSNLAYSYCPYDGEKYHNNPSKFGITYGLTAGGGDTIMCAHDPISGKVWWGKNGTWFAGGDPVAGTGEAFDECTGEMLASFSARTYGAKVTLRSAPEELVYSPPAGFVAGIFGEPARAPVPATIQSVLGIGSQVRFLEDAPPVGGNDEYTTFLLHSNGNQGSTIFEDSGFNRPASRFGELRGDPFHTQGYKKYDRSSIEFNGSDAVVEFDGWTWSFGIDELTIDFWLYLHYNAHDNNGIINASDNYLGGWGIFFEGEVGVDGGQQIVFKGDTKDFYNYCKSAVDCLPLDQWNHIAVVKTRDPQVYQFFVNGNPSGDAGANERHPSSSRYLSIGNKEYGTWWSGELLHGWIDEIRISKGVARYTAPFTLPDGPYSSLQTDTSPEINAIIGIGSLIEVFSDVELPPAESFGNDLYTVLLIHSNSVQGDSEFIDASNYAEPLLTVGNTIHDDDDPKMGATAILFDGYQDQINTAKLSIYEPGFNPFTIDFWIKPNSHVYHAGIMTSGDVATGGWVIEYDNSGHLRFVANGVVVCVTTDFVPFGVWTHVALVRRNTSTTGYQFWVGGYASGEPGDATLSLPTTANGIMIGRGNAAFWPSLYYDGLLDEIRISDIARFTEPFTVKETPYTSPVTEYNPEIFAGIGISAKVWAGEDPRTPIKMINAKIGIGAGVRIGTCSIQEVNVGIGIGAKMAVHHYRYADEVNVGIGIGCALEFQKIRIARAVNVKIGIGSSVTMSTPRYVAIRAGIGIGTRMTGHSIQAVVLNAGIGIRGSISINNNGNEEETECSLPAFSRDRWC